MNNLNLRVLLNEYDKKRNFAILDADKRKKELYSSYPRLQEIEDEISREAIKTSKLMILNKDNNLLSELNIKIDNLKAKKKNYLNSIKIDENYLKPKYECSICNDTGYVLNTYPSLMCNCLKQKLFDIEYNKSNILNLKNDNFENFNSLYYSEVVDEEKYQKNISPRENIEKIKNASVEFINNFDDVNQKNILFCGNTGLGKSFLSSCIANELLKKGKTVLYQTAPIMLESIIDYRFGKKDSFKDIYDNLLDVDLLIIDDLGTECMNSMKFAELFNIINTRLLNSNSKPIKTLISTNLSLNNLFSAYDERIISRIVGNYNIYYFFGDDIRFKKR